MGGRVGVCRRFPVTRARAVAAFPIGLQADIETRTIRYRYIDDGLFDFDGQNDLVEREVTLGGGMRFAAGAQFGLAWSLEPRGLDRGGGDPTCGP